MVSIPEQLASERRLQEDKQTARTRKRTVKAHPVCGSRKPGTVSSDTLVADTLLLLQLHRGNIK